MASVCASLPQRAGRVWSDTPVSFPEQMQQQELAQMRQRDANLTALAAIGPRKKRKVDSPGPGSGPEVQGAAGTEGCRGPRGLSRRTSPGGPLGTGFPRVHVTL